MRDIARKRRTRRSATARATVAVSPQTVELIRQNMIPKGDPFPVARVAAIQAAKSTSQIIPYCHSLLLDFVECTFTVRHDAIDIETSVRATYKTGVEMEALTAASVAALTLYDMLKMVDASMEIRSIFLTGKEGGESGLTTEVERPARAAVLVISDSVAEGRAGDTSGAAVVKRLKESRFHIAEHTVIPDDVGEIERVLLRYTDELHVDLVITTGGTGLGPRDVTPEATRRVIEREVPGIAELLRAYGQERTPYAILSRGVAGIRRRTLLVNLPGSLQGVEEPLDLLLPAIVHSLHVMHGGGHADPKTGATGTGTHAPA